jgi:hypothetical protein
MGRLVTFVMGILVGVALKWQYDQQQTPAPVAATQPTERTAAAVQVIPITVEESARPAHPSAAG